MYRNPKIDSRHLLAATVVAVATALSMSSSAFATDAPAGAKPASEQDAACAAGDTTPVTGTRIRRCDTTNLETIHVVGYPGAVLGPGDAKWTDDDASAPELPMTREGVKR